MANPEQFAKLQEGTSIWNGWRKNNPAAIIDLKGARLSGAQLSDANLRAADLRKADLGSANLAGANLRRSYLGEANLEGAYLRRASLREASLRWANLTGADLTGAYLSGADLHEADLSRAELARATLRGTIFANTNLRGAKGLALCRHTGPSSLGIDTFVRSSGEISEGFLRGCGVPDQFITYARSLAGHPIEFYSCFISYSTKDQEFADRLYADLQSHAVRCWFAPHDIAGGKKVHEQIDEAIRVYDRLLLILSEHSMKSSWVETEISKARKRELREGRQMLFPLRLVDFAILRDWERFDADTGKDSAREIREYFIPDFSNWKNHDSYKLAFDRLLRDLKSKGDVPRKPA